MNQLTLFQTPSVTAATLPTNTQRHLVLARIGAERLAQFAWWCRHGNRDMCAAWLWKEHGFTKAGANSAVLELSEGNGNG